MTKVIAHTLPNGMLVLTREVHSAPVASCCVWYRVGSRNETPGTTGISHWVEHMLFKGTPNIPKGEMDRLIARNGGTFNGFTSSDYTAYFETLPADRIELGLRIESDRMVNSLFDTDEIESERSVIISEREGHENDPEWWLSEAMMAATFQFHPYRNEVIGWKSDLRAITREELYTHYQTYYMPNNAVLVLVGDFQTDVIMQQVEQHFGGLPSARIYRALVETQLAAYASSGYRPARDPYLFDLDATVHEGHSADEIEAALIQEVERIQQDGVDMAEMSKVIKQARALMAYSSESVTQQGLRLGMWEVLDSYQRLDTLIDALSAVTAADIQRVAQTYLTERNRTVGHFIPTGD